MRSYMELPRHLRIQLEAIKSATKNFAAKNLIGHGGFGRVYKGKLSSSWGYITVAVKRFDPESKQGRPEFLAEIKILSGCKHENLVLLVGFCEEREEKILVYRFEANRSLDEHLSTDQAGSLTWIQRLNLCYGTARGLDYLHNRVGTQHRVIHRDIKSSNILLDENWNAKISDFGLAKIVSANMGDTSLNTNPAGTIGYIDPLYRDKGILTMKTDVYSFGVVLFEVLCGRKAWMPEYNDERRSLSTLAKRHYEDKCMDNIIDPILRRQMKQESLDTFLRIAYQCLLHEQEQRPSITQVVKELNRAIILQLGVVAVAINGTSTSKYIVKWALAKFVPEGMHMFKLLYVHPRITYVPTPMGNRIHISKANEVVVAAFMKEEKWRVNRMLLPYKNMCAERKAQAEIMHIESDNVVSAIKQEILNSDIRNLVIGASSPSPFRCLFAAKPSLSSRISDSAPRFCTVYTVLKRELRSVRPSDVENNGNTEDSTSIDRSSVFSSMDTSSVSSHAHCSTASSLTEILLASSHIPQAEGRSQGHNNWDGHRIWLFVKKFSSRSDRKKIAYFIIYIFVTIIIHILNNRGVIRQLGKIFDHEYS